MIDWLEEILSTAEQQAGEDGREGDLASLLAKTGAVIPNWVEPADRRKIHPGLQGENGDEFPGGTNLVQNGMETASAETGDPEMSRPDGEGPFLSEAKRRDGENSVLRELYRQSVAGGALQFLYARSHSHSALRSLYRQVSETVRREPATAGNRRNIVVEREESPVAGGFSMGEFDRAARRDSRRYDGGMSIY